MMGMKLVEERQCPLLTGNEKVGEVVGRSGSADREERGDEQGSSEGRLEGWHRGLRGRKDGWEGR